MKKLTVNVDKGYDILKRELRPIAANISAKFQKQKRFALSAIQMFFLSTVRALRFRLKQADLMFMNIFSLPVKAQKNLPK